MPAPRQTAETRARASRRDPRGPRGRTSARRSAGLIAGLLAVPAACGGGAEPTGRVLHLDPRLADARSATEVLLDAPDAWISEHRFEPGEDHGPWSLLYADMAEAPGGGVRLTTNQKQGHRDRQVELAWTGTLHADEANLIELEIVASEAGVAQLRWQSENQRNQVVRLNVQIPGRGRHRVRFTPGGGEDWFGELTNVRIAPGHTGNSDFVLRAARVGRAPINLGISPLEGEVRDAGLVELNETSLRSWPTDWGVPLHERVRVPASGRFAVAFAAPRARADGAHFFVEARVGEGKWHSVAEKSFLGERVALLDSWQYLTANLERWGGREIELRLRAELGQAPAAASDDAELREARVLFGAPMVTGEPPADRWPNIVLVTLDTLRTDAVGAYNPGEGRTPFLDRLAAQGIVFENAWSTCNATSPSHASLLTGLSVQDHGVVNNRSILAPEIATVAEALRERGYHTLAAVSAAHLNPSRSGMGQGFDQYFSARDGAARDGSITTHVVKDWISKWSRLGDRPFFLWLHLFDAHTPYGPPERFMPTYVERYGEPIPDRIDDARAIPATFLQEPGRFLEGANNPEFARYLYRAGVAYTDELVREFYEELSESIPLDQTAFFFTADHGESLGEQSIWFDHIGLYRDVMHVPLIVTLPGVSPRRIPNLVSSVDVPVTLLSLAGLGVPDGSRGADLGALIHGGDWTDRSVWFEHVNNHQLGCRDDQYHFIQTLVPTNLGGSHPLVQPGTSQLFDHTADQGLGSDLAADAPGVIEEYLSRLESWRESALKIRTIQGDLSAEEESELKALGYTSGASEE